MFKGYKENCETFVKKWIDKNTLYKSKNVTLQDYKESRVDFKVEIKNEFKVVSQSANGGKDFGVMWQNIGKPFVEKGFKFKSVKYYTQKEYDSALKQEIKALDSKENLEYLFELVNKGNYAYFDKNSTFLMGKTIIYYEFKCPTCRGQGTVKCDCRGGRIKCYAWGCNNGKIKKSESKNGRKRTYYVDCDSCQGTGWKTCYKCDGSSVLDCNDCSFGIQTKITIIICNTEPTIQALYNSDLNENLRTAFEQVGAANFAQIAEIKRTEIKVLDAEKVVFESYEVSVPVVEFNIAIKNKTYPFKVYGSDVRVLESGKIPLKANFYRAVVSVLAVVAVVAFACYLYIVTSPQNSSQNVELNDNKPQQNTIKLVIPKGSFVNLRESPNGKIINKIHAENLSEITIVKLDGGDDKWVRVLYFPPSVMDETKAISGYIHSSKIDKNSLQK